MTTKNFSEKQHDTEKSRKFIITYDIDSRDKEFYSAIHNAMKDNMEKITESTYISKRVYTIAQINHIVKSLKTSFSRHRESIQDTSKVTIIFPRDSELIIETIVRPER